MKYTNIQHDMYEMNETHPVLIEKSIDSIASHAKGYHIHSLCVGLPLFFQHCFVIVIGLYYH